MKSHVGARVDDWRKRITHIMPPQLIIIRKLDKTNGTKLAIHFANDVYLGTRWVPRIRLDACNAKVYLH